MSHILIRLFSGWRWIRIQGRHSERLITELIGQGYPLWRIQRVPDGLRALVTEPGYEAICLLAEKYHLTIRSERRGGLPFRWQQLKLRPFLVVGLAFACSVVIYGTSHVWAISVTAPGLSESQRVELIKQAEASGLTIGSSRNRLDLARIRRLMVSRMPEYSWVGIHIEGMVAQIDAVHFVARPADHLPPRLVATHDGKVTSIAVYMGDPEVLVGEEVKRGQTLISGVVTGNLPIQPNDAKKPVEDSVVTPAEGEVMADVTYRVKRFQPFSERRWETDGHHRQALAVVLDRQKTIELPMLRSLPYQHYDVQRTIESVRFAGIELPVQIIRIVYNEKVSRMVRLTRQAALQVDKEACLQELAKKTSSAGTRVRQKTAVQWTPSGVWVEMTSVVNQNIAAPPAREAKRS